MAEFAYAYLRSSSLLLTAYGLIANRILPIACGSWLTVESLMVRIAYGSLLTVTVHYLPLSTFWLGQ